MRDEVLIKRPLVAMVTWILANKRVREKCLLGDGERGGGPRQEGPRWSEVSGPGPRQPGAALPLSFPSCLQTDSGDHSPPPPKVKYALLHKIITC